MLCSAYVGNILQEATVAEKIVRFPLLGRTLCFSGRAHLPPKPTEALRNLEPIRVSRPQAYATSSISAPVASQIAERALMEEIRWASRALAA